MHWLLLVTLSGSPKTVVSVAFAEKSTCEEAANHVLAVRGSTIHPKTECKDMSKDPK